MNLKTRFPKTMRWLEIIIRRFKQANVTNNAFIKRLNPSWFPFCRVEVVEVFQSGSL